MDYKTELKWYLVKATEINDQEWLERFFASHEDLERDFRSYKAVGGPLLDEWLVELAAEARRHYEAYYDPKYDDPETETGEIRPRRQHKSKKSSNTAEPWDRQEALGKYLARFAEDHPDIQRFREELLGGTTLNAEEARELISSPYAASRPLSFAKRHGRNALRCPLSIQDTEDEDGWPYRSVTVRGKTKAFSFEIRPLMRTASKGLIFPGDVVEPWDVRTQQWLPDRNAEPRVFLFPHPEEKSHYVAATEKSVLAVLARLSEQRLRGYPISPEKGSWFILTGEFIPTNPVRIFYENLKHPNFQHSTITVEAESWMSPEEIAEHYRYAQKQILGKTPRSLEAKSLDVFDFVNRNKGKTLDERLRVRNKKNPTCRFGQRGHFYHAYKRDLRKIASPDDWS